MKYVIIGGDAAGMSAAMQIVRNDQHADIVTLEKGGIYSYAQCGLPYAISGLVPETDSLIARSVDTFREKYGINAKVYHEVTSVNPDDRTVSGVDTITGEKFTFEYGKLLIASGGSPYVPPFQGMDLGRIHTLKTIPDAKNIQGDLADDVNDITIVGGGYIGLEMAESFKVLGKNVRLIQRGNQLTSIFDRDMADHIYNEAIKHGIEVALNENVLAFHGNGTVESVVTDKNEYSTGLVLIATGIRPNTDFAKDTGISFGVKGAIEVNEYMETNVKDIYAAGDCAVQYHIVKEKNDYIPLGTTANKQGRIAGLNMAGKTRAFAGVAGTSIIRFMDLTLGRTGLSESEAESLNIPYETVTIKTRHIAGYYPGSKPLHLKLVYHSETDRLLGAQAIGEEGVDKRIDVLAAALFNRMAVKELEDLDLSYAPPFNGVWDPVQQAARRANSK